MYESEPKFKSPKGAKRYIEDVAPIPCQASIRTREDGYTISVVAPLHRDVYAIVVGPDLTELAYKAVEELGRSWARANRKLAEAIHRAGVYEQPLCPN